MDLRHYFRKLREAEAALTEEFPLVISLETTDGGKGGQLTEVSRHQAARLIVEGRATLASDLDRERYCTEQEAKKKAAEKAELSKRVQVAIIADPDMQANPAKKK
jgi:hypothetical protein